MYFDSKLRREHQVVLNGLRCGIGVAVVTGERGVGKTTLLHSLAAELDFADHLVVSVSCLGSPSLGDIMAAFGFRIGFPGQPKADRGVKSRTCLSEMLGFLGVCGTTAILFLDDADSLSAETLSGLLSMSNKGSENGATVSIVLAGSLDLARRLERISNPSSDKKLDLIVPVSPLESDDVESYISHRLQVTGHGEAPVFEPEAIDRIAHYAHGNPQAINRICRAAMVIAADQSHETVSKHMVEQVTWSARDGRAQEAAQTGKCEDPGVDGAHGGTKPALEVVTSSDREPNARLPVEIHDIPRDRTLAPKRRRLVTLGALSAIAAVALYLVAGGETTDGRSITTDVAANTNAEDSKEDPSQSTFVAASVSEQRGLSQRENEPAQPLERQESMPREASGSVLEQAVYLGDVKAVSALLDAGADINAPVSGGRTLLMVAADSGDRSMVMALIDRGADVSLGRVDVTAVGADQRPSGFETSAGSATSASAQTRRTASGEGQNADPRGNLGREVIPSPVGGGRGPLSLVRPPSTSASVLARSPTDPGERDITMAEAANKGAEHDTNKAGSTDLGVTPLIAAAGAGHAYVVDVLLAAGADVNAADARGRTPLIAAVDSGDRVSVGLMLARDADLHAVDDTERSALDIARENSRWDLVDLISVRAKHPPVQTAALQLSATAQQSLAHAGDTHAEGNAAVTQQRPKLSRVRKQSVLGGVNNRGRVPLTQRYLRRLGYDPGPVDGVRGAKTRSAVRQFQSDQGLKVDGKITAGLLVSLAAEAGTRGARQSTAETPAETELTPDIKNVFLSMLSGLQTLRGLDFNSKENPKKIYGYCEKNRGSWIYDKGIGETTYCKNYMRSKRL